MAAPWIATTQADWPGALSEQEGFAALQEDFSGANWNDGGPEPVPTFFSGTAGWGIPIFTP